jgi:hypothetical protein
VEVGVLMPIFTAVIREIRAVDCVYKVEAKDEDEAEDLLFTESVAVGEEQTYEVMDRLIIEPPTYEEFDAFEDVGGGDGPLICD